MERISSRHNPIVKRFRDLARTGGDDSMLLEGAHLVEEALASGTRFELVAFADRAIDGAHAELVGQAQRAGAKVVAVTDPVMAAMSPVRQPSGIVGIAERPTAPSDAVFSGDRQLVLMLSDVQDPGNVGAIVRAAEACGATGVVAGDATADPFGWKALRGAMGSTFRVPVARQPLHESIERARAAGLRIVAAVAREGTPLRECDLNAPAAILLGGEGPGLAQALLDAADERITIPMRPPVESLNVAIAAALILYEAQGQRR